MNLEELSRNYRVEITIDQMMKLMVIDYDDVAPQLIELGADDIDYNPHFGPGIFFRAEAEAAEAIHKKIMEIVNEI